MSADSVQVPPQAIDAEMAVLGSMLIEPIAVERAVEFLNEDNFYKDAHRKIFSAAFKLHKLSQPVDLVTMGAELRRLKLLSEVGGSEYLASLTHIVSTAAHIDHYSNIVREKAVLRELIKISTKIVGECYSEKRDAQELLDLAQRDVLEVAQQRAVTGFANTNDLAHETINQIEKLAQQKTDVTGVSSGLRDLDKRTGGFQKGDLILIAARPSQGKTALALNIASHVALQETPIPIAVFSLEMDKHAIMTRFIASEAGVDLHKVRNGFFPRDRWVSLTSAASDLSNAPLFIDDSSALSVLEVRSRTRRLATELRSKGQELGMVIIDYLQLMRGSHSRIESRQQEVSEISRGLKGLARDLKVPVIALSQLSRRVEDKGRPDAKPQLSDLRESGALEQDADLVAFIYREGYYKRNDPSLERSAEIIIAKHRNGPTGAVKLSFLPHLTRFENAMQSDTGADEMPPPSGETQVEF